MEEFSHAPLEQFVTKGVIKHSENQLGCKIRKNEQLISKIYKLLES